MKKIVIAGVTTIDITPSFPKDAKGDFKTYVRPGSMIKTEKLNFNPGGCTSNTGLALMKLGADVRLIMKCGKDNLSDILRKEYEKINIEKVFVTGDEDTSYSVILAIPGADRIFYHNPGANDTFVSSDIKDEYLDGAEIFHFGYPQSMISMCYDGGKELVDLYKRVKNLHITTSLDMCLTAREFDWKSVVVNVAPYVDIFVPSIEELSVALDKENYDKLARRCIDEGKDFTDMVDYTYAKTLANMALNLGVKEIMIKCGTKGIFYKSAKEEFAMPCFVPEKVISGTGAGDVSIAAFLYSVQKGLERKKAVEFATAAGAICVTTIDATSGIPSFDELVKMVDSGWKKSDYTL